ncbi:hypothetical protein [Brevundimonas vancanneytii]|uniref:Uncharacterized protein n=1 Tax=Brevundimonas vancanneytii TaxID=1325724 RepID=A0A4P1K8M2_9CAUL|nr:hypothetical protein [Brevundimonas vancanneytii]VTO16767.1 Uncharacterised protein [Brevundimonas vancanneytii]
MKDAYLRVGALVCVAQLGAGRPDGAVTVADRWRHRRRLGYCHHGGDGRTGRAALQQLTPGTLRGQAGAFYTLVANLLGLSLVPLLVGLATDRVFADPGMVGLSLLTVGAVVLLLGAGLLWLGKDRFILRADGDADSSERPPERNEPHVFDPSFRHSPPLAGRASALLGAGGLIRCCHLWTAPALQG